MFVVRELQSPGAIALTTRRRTIRAMPELPEVETIVRDLRAAGVPGRRIAGVRVLRPAVLGREEAGDFRRSLAGRTVEGIARRGKHIVFALSGSFAMLVHLRMSGQFRVEDAGLPVDRHDRLLLLLDDGRRLAYHDTRAFGRILLTDGPEEALGHLGPEPLGPQWRPAAFRAALAGRRQAIKALLLDQSFLAGVGNIYADEALWLARVHPLRAGSSLSAAEAGRLFRSVRTVLARAVRNRGTTLGGGDGNYRDAGRSPGANRPALKAYGRAGLPCPRCGEVMTRLRAAGRGTCACPSCQPAP